MSLLQADRTFDEQPKARTHTELERHGDNCASQYFTSARLLLVSEPPTSLSSSAPSRHLPPGYQFCSQCLLHRAEGVEAA